MPPSSSSGWATIIIRLAHVCSFFNVCANPSAPRSSGRVSASGEAAIEVCHGVTWADSGAAKSRPTIARTDAERRRVKAAVCMYCQCTIRGILYSQALLLPRPVADLQDPDPAGTPANPIDHPINVGFVAIEQLPERWILWRTHTALRLDGEAQDRSFEAVEPLESTF